MISPTSYHFHPLSFLLSVSSQTTSLNIVVWSPPFYRYSSCPPCVLSNSLSIPSLFYCLCPQRQRPLTLWCSLRRFTDVPIVPLCSCPTQLSMPSLFYCLCPHRQLSLNIVVQSPPVSPMFLLSLRVPVPLTFNTFSLLLSVSPKTTSPNIVCSSATTQIYWTQTIAAPYATMIKIYKFTPIEIITIYSWN